MAFGLYSLLEAALLVVNAIAILNRERFLSKGWVSVAFFIFVFLEIFVFVRFILP